MLPSLRTILAAMFVTAILVTMVGTALTPIYPRVKQPLARYARTEGAMEEPGMRGRARRSEELKRQSTVEPSSEDRGTSRHAKTLITARVDPAANDTPGSTSVSAPEKPATNPTQRADASATGSVNRATTESPGSLGGPAASFAAMSARTRPPRSPARLRARPSSPANRFAK